MVEESVVVVEQYSSQALQQLGFDYAQKMTKMVASDSAVEDPVCSKAPAVVVAAVVVPELTVLAYFDLALLQLDRNTAGTSSLLYS